MEDIINVRYEDMCELEERVVRFERRMEDEFSYLLNRQREFGRGFQNSRYKEVDRCVSACDRRVSEILGELRSYREDLAARSEIIRYMEKR